MVASRSPGIRSRADPVLPSIKAFPPEISAALHARGVRRAWVDGTTVLAHGLVVPWVQVVLRGRLRITSPATPGHEVFFRWQQPGEVVGLASAVSGRPLPVDIVAFDDCVTLQVERDALLEMLRSDVCVAMSAAQLLAGYAYDLIELVTVRTEATLTHRVLGVLRHLAVLNGQPEGPGTWSLAISQRDVAAAVGASRQRVNAELRTLEREGLIELGYRRLRVHGVPSAA
jgi:CRP-like cAMP-binding protein